MRTDPGHICTAAEDTHWQIFRGTSSPITVPLEVEPQLEDVVVKLTSKSPLV